MTYKEIIKNRILEDLKEYKDLIKYVRYTKKGLTIRFNDNKTKMIKVNYTNDYLKQLEENKNMYSNEIFNLILDLKY